MHIILNINILIKICLKDLYKIIEFKQILIMINKEIYSTLLDII